MIIGDPGRFAIESEYETTTASGLAIGRLRFWLGGEAVGDWDDTVHLKACVAWLRDFVESPRNRYERHLVGATAEEVFDRAFTAVIRLHGEPRTDATPVDDAVERFHIAHLGMSSFNAYDLLLLKDDAGNERCLWRGPHGGRIRDVRLGPREMEGVAQAFCDEMGPLIGV